MEATFNSSLDSISAGEDLSREEMTSAINHLMSGKCNSEQIGLFLTTLASKGETAVEVAGAAAAMRNNMTPIRSRHSKLLDTCGTGGGGSKTFNISTSAALVIAASGVPLAKHGNRSVTSKSGSADVLDELGVNISADVSQVERCLDELGICFCFAPLMHPAMKYVAEVRKKLGIRTIFNLLGPLANPAGATHQLLGVGRPELRPLIASALGELEIEHALVVSGSDGLGEATIAATTNVTAIKKGSESHFDWEPEQFGIQKSPVDSILIDTPTESASIIQDVLAGKSGPARDIVILNAAAGLIAAEQTEDPIEAASRVSEAIDNGAAKELLEKLAKLSHQS